MILGLDIGGTNIKAGVVNAGKIVRRYRFPTRAHQRQAAVEQIKRVVDRFAGRISAVGIGCAGIIDSEKGIVRYSPNFAGWENVELGPILARDFNKPVRVINDVNAIMLGEWKYGAARGYDNAFLFTLGTGVGGAAVVEGKLLFGACGFAGEFGHTTIDFKGPRCACGNRGCLERYVGSRHIVDLARRLIRNERSALRAYGALSPRIIAREARRGDRVARAVFDRIGTYIGIGVSSIVNLLDPEIVIVSGGIARAGAILFDPVRRTVDQLILGATFRDLKIIPAKLGDDAGVLGAAAWAAEKSVRKR
ncbi:MAG TPA: ROK family protein [bacterium]